MNNTGEDNTAVGAGALDSNTFGEENTAIGVGALFFNTTASDNTAVGSHALNNNTGDFNTAVGDEALGFNTTGSNNTAIGVSAGSNATTGSGNVYIGSISGAAGESDHTYIRNINTTTVSGGGTDTVTVNLSTGLLGHLSSSRRYKEDIKPMDQASEALYRLKPVSYRFKKEIDSSQSLDYGLIAEDVAKIDPNLAIRDGKGQIESVRYNAVNAMLLNEFLKEHRKVEAQQESIARLRSAIAQERKSFESRLAQQENQIETLRSGLQKVNAAIELSGLKSQIASH
jgi:hypothetical protein